MTIFYGGEHHDTSCPLCKQKGTTKDISYWGDYITCKFCYIAEQSLSSKHQAEIVKASLKLRKMKEKKNET